VTEAAAKSGDSSEPLSPTLTPDNLPLSQAKNDPISADMALDENVRSYVREAFSDNTRRAYRADLLHFQTWGGTIPATPELVARYIADHGGKLSAATLGRRLVAISKAHTSRGLQSPCATDLARATLRGVRRAHGVAQRQAKPLLVQDLLLILDRLGTKPKDLRDRALLLLGFAAALRRSELVDLDVSDIQDVPQGMVINLRRSKTDQDGEGRKIGIPYARGRHCPVHALREWLSGASITEGPAFRPVDRHGRITPERLSTQAVSEVVKSRIRVLGHNPKDYSGHSLRAGLATSAALAGLSSWKIRQQTGHASEAMLGRYIRDGELFRGNVAGNLL
jgi:integrase